MATDDTAPQWLWPGRLPTGEHAIITAYTGPAAPSALRVVLALAAAVPPVTDEGRCLLCQEDGAWHLASWHGASCPWRMAREFVAALGGEVAPAGSRESVAEHVAQWHRDHPEAYPAEDQDPPAGA